MSLKSNSRLMLVAVLACWVATPAKAMTFTYDLAFSGGQSGSLVLDNLSSAPSGTYTGAALTTFLSSSFVSLDSGLFKNQQFDIGSAQSADITKLVFSNTGVLTAIDASIKISSPADTLIYSGLAYNFENPAGHSSGSGTLSVSAPVSTTPLPDAFPLFATGLAVLGLVGWRKRRKNTASTGPALTAV